MLARCLKRRKATKLPSSVRTRSIWSQTTKAIDLLGRATIYDIELLGIAAEKSRVDAVRVERVQTRASCLNDPDAAGAVRESLALCEKLVRGLRGSLWSYARSALSPGERDPDKKDVSNFVKSLGAEPAAWSALGDPLRHVPEKPGRRPR